MKEVEAVARRRTRMKMMLAGVAAATGSGLLARESETENGDISEQRNKWYYSESLNTEHSKSKARRRSPVRSLT